MIVVPRRRACLKNERRDRVVGGGVAAGDDRHVGVDHVAVGGGHRAGADALEQRGHRGGVAQPGAVVDVVGAEAGPDQLLEEVGLLVGALGRTEAGDRARARRRRGSRPAAGRPGPVPPPRWPPGSAAAPRRSRRDRPACGWRRPLALLAALTASPRGPRRRSRPSGRFTRRARRRTAAPSGRPRQSGSAAPSAAAVTPRSPSRTGP